MRLHSLLSSTGAAALLIAGLPGVAAADPPSSPAAPFSAADRAKAVEVSLITGDTVLVTPEGKIGFNPGPGRSGTPYVSYLKGTGDKPDRYVIPGDAIEPLQKGLLDERLFDVTDLVADGYAGRELPLIVRDAPGAFAAASADKGVWDKVKGDRVEKVWLDAKAHVTLAESVPQIGAPAAWEAGYTGEGIKVAVLDTGYDPTHPDLSGHVAAAKDFTDTSPEAVDGFGHGTHVASTIAGSGAASNGKYKGVAPGAKLLIGKVCSDAGECFDSDIIEGLQWAADNGASIVNLSLGGGPTDGTDSLSMAVNEFSERTGMLIVVAAGNFGCRECVGTPGGADKALTVGSVTKQDELSIFSSQGPRTGDGALKPDLTAPGSEITAARAKGTTMGTPVDDNYITADGTSMATPHVAGAAAIIKQAHPGWSAERMKAAMMGTSKGLDGLGVFQQGAGRVDVATAVSAKITADGSLSFGTFHQPVTENPAPKTVTYTNDGDTDVTLNLAVTGDARFTVDRSTVTVPAHGTATASVSATLVDATQADLGAVLTATADGVSIRTAMGAVVPELTYHVKVTVKSRTGGPIGDDYGLGAFLVGLDDFSVKGIRPDAGGEAVVDVPAGRYLITGVAPERGADPSITRFANAITVTGDMATTLDLTAGELVDVDLDADDAVPFQTLDTIFVIGEDGYPRFGVTLGGEGVPVYSVPNPDLGVAMTLVHGATFGSPEGSANPYSYSTFFTSNVTAMPGRTTFTAHNNELAREDAVYHSQGKDTVGQRTDWYMGIEPYVIEQPNTPVPGRRTEYFTPGEWDGTFQLGGSDEVSQLGLRSAVQRVAGTTKSVVWGRAPLGPGPVYSTRNGDFTQFVPAMYDDTNPEVWSSETWASNITGSSKLTVDGKEIPLGEGSGCNRYGDLPTGTSGAFEFTCDTTRVNEFSTIGTASSATWKFHSEPSTDSVITPMLGVRLSSPSVVNGYAPVSKIQKLDLDVFRPDTTGKLGTKTLTLEVSYDDGATWKSVPVALIGDHALTLLAHPKGAKFVSTRITAVDADGNSVTQKTIRSYGLS